VAALTRSASFIEHGMIVYATQRAAMQAAVELPKRPIPPAKVLILPEGLQHEFSAEELSNIPGETAVFRCKATDWLLVTQSGIFGIKANNPPAYYQGLRASRSSAAVSAALAAKISYS